MLPLALSWWRGLDLNQRPPGYEPDELPLLYPAIMLVQEVHNQVIAAHSSSLCVYRLMHRMIKVCF
jgi:hypothetical protein